MKKAKSESQNARTKRLERGEMALIRIGHHIFRLWRAGGRVDGYLDESLNTVWTLKAQIRAEKRKLRPTPSPNYRKPSRAASREAHDDRAGAGVTRVESESLMLGREKETKR